MQRRLKNSLLPLALCLGGPAFAAGAPAQDPADTAWVERGRYLATVAGCNDCHTQGYMESGGNVAEAERLTGSALGFQGPWGTTYPANLRLLVQSMDEARWLTHARAQTRPPMPWFNLRATSDDDLRALYRYLRHLGPKGQPAPAYVPPGQTVRTPYFDFTPKNLPPQAAAAAPASTAP